MFFKNFVLPNFCYLYSVFSIGYLKTKFLNNNVRDYTDVETPCSISNQEAKHIVGDDTTPYWQGESSSLRTLFSFLKFKFNHTKGLNSMFDYIIFRTKRALLQFFCNFIPFQNLRIKARNAVYAKFLGTKVVLLNEVDSHLPQKV